MSTQKGVFNRRGCVLNLLDCVLPQAVQHSNKLGKKLTRAKMTKIINLIAIIASVYLFHVNADEDLQHIIRNRRYKRSSGQFKKKVFVNSLNFEVADCDILNPACRAQIDENNRSNNRNNNWKPSFRGDQK